MEENGGCFGAVVKEDVPEKVTSEQTPEGGQGYLEGELSK